jgi:uracil-DNA glycosylase
MRDATQNLLREVRACTLCAAHLPLGPRPVLQAHARARILVVGQAPGRLAHGTGLPFSDPSGDRLRAWMGIDKETFYDPLCVALLPMGFCYPGTGDSGDLAPRSECAHVWRAPLLATMPDIRLTLVMGQYALAWHLHQSRSSSLERTVRAWRSYGPAVLPMPHPSPRNNLWLRRNAWFEREVIPWLQQRVRQVLQG